MKITPALLIILDGFGCREEATDNAIKRAHTPNWDSLWRHYPHSLIGASESAVGLPAEQMGNSEVGHLNIGAGRVVYQDYTRINNAIQNGSFFENPVLLEAIRHAQEHQGALHVIGLLSEGGVHSHADHIEAMVELAARHHLGKVFLHIFLDGRDTPPKSALNYIRRLEARCEVLGTGKILSLIGRYYAMDRDSRWARTQQAYDLITAGQADYVYETAIEAVEAAYARGETDEFIKASSIRPIGAAPYRMQAQDAAVFMNFRSDRARQLTRAFTERDFSGFQRAWWPKDMPFFTLTSYAHDILAPMAFPPETIQNSFGEYLSRLGLKQLRIAETEKYAHVTFFFNGGKEQPYPGEERILVPSPNVATYDLKPEMSAFEVTDRLVEAIRSGRYDAIICNYANADMVGHTGNLEATTRAIEALDACIGRVVAAQRAMGGEVVITADHGNAEMMQDTHTHQAHTAHTINPVPFLYIGRPAHMASDGALSDVAPSLLSIMGLPQPPEMSGHSLITLE